MLSYEQSSWESLKCMFINGMVDRKVSWWTRWRKKITPHQIILALHLTALKVNGPYARLWDDQSIKALYQSK